MPEEILLFWTDMSKELWNGVPQNGEDLSYMFDDETTPVKACGDLAYLSSKIILLQEIFINIVLLTCASHWIVPFPVFTVLGQLLTLTKVNSQVIYKRSQRSVERLLLKWRGGGCCSSATKTGIFLCPVKTCHHHTWN